MPTAKSSETRIGFSLSQTYKAPLAAVWDAATQAKHLNKFFTTGAKGDITPAAVHVLWAWKGAGEALVTITECELHRSVQFKWKGPQNEETLVRWEFKREKGKTVIRLYEAGWKHDHIDKAFDHCGGWSEFLYGLKAYVQHGIDLRK
jgi:uncharacterized protein YndB with AHSA1/START domain